VRAWSLSSLVLVASQQHRRLNVRARRLIAFYCRTLSRIVTRGASCQKDPDLNTFPSSAEVRRYFQAYSDANHLEPLFHYRSTVVKVERTEAVEEGKEQDEPQQQHQHQHQQNRQHRRWRVTYRVQHPSGGSSLHARCFDVVFCCTGQFSQPSVPAIPGLDSFDGVVCHSRDYHCPADVLKPRSPPPGPSRLPLRPLPTAYCLRACPPRCDGFNFRTPAPDEALRFYEFFIDYGVCVRACLRARRCVRADALDTAVVKSARANVQ
jgi:hypothetical protein